MYACFGSLALNAVLVAGITYVGTTSKVVPYVVQVDALGQAAAVHILRPPEPPEAKEIREHLARWVSDVRTVYNDRRAQVNIATEAYHWTAASSEAKTWLDKFLRGNPPTDRAKKETVNVSIKAVSQIGSTLWWVDWTEETVPTDGRPGAVVVAWRATIEIQIDTPKTQTEVLENPRGIYVVRFNPNQMVSK